MANERKWAVTVVFETATGVTVRRDLPVIRDTFRSSALARGVRNGVPGNAKVITATAKAVG